MNNISKIFKKLDNLDEEIFPLLLNSCKRTNHIAESNMRYEIARTVFLQLAKRRGFPELFVDYINNFERNKLRSNNFYSLLRLFNCSLNPNSFDTRYEVKNDWERKQAHFHYIPYSVYDFIYLIRKTKKFKKKRFLDVGHGTGSKIILAYLFGDFESAGGIEYNEFTFNLSQKYIKDWTRFKEYEMYGDDYKKRYELAPKYNIHKGDALKFKDYSEYDYVYMYKPMSDNRQMAKLYNKIFNDCKVGTLIINVLDFDQIFADRDFYPEESRIDSKFTFINARNGKNRSSGFVLIKIGKNKFKVERINY